MTMNAWKAAVAVGLFGLLAVNLDAAAGDRPAGDAPADAKGAKKDPYAIPEMKLTKIGEFDSFFETGKSPIESLILTRKKVDMAQGRINTSLGLAEGVTFADSVAELKKRVEVKTKIALKKGTMPRITTADVVPDDVQKAIDEFNASLQDMESAFTTLSDVKGQLATLATQAVDLPGKAPEAAKAAGLSATDTMAAIKNTGTDVKILSTSKDESEKLFTSLSSVTTDLEAAFGAAVP